MPTKLPDDVSRYFERDPIATSNRSSTTLLMKATVIDEGEARDGTAEIRAWQTA